MGGQEAEEARGGGRPWRDGLLLAAVCLSAHFALCGRFGLYLDDAVYAGQPAGWSWAGAGAAVRYALLELPEGRPLAFLIGRLVPFLCWRAGLGLPALYLCGAAWVVGNALLCRALLARRWGATAGLLGALAFALFPADTTHALLTHALALQPAVTFLLLALHAHGRGRTLAAFALAAGALLTYETAVLPFALAPLLGEAPWDRRLLLRTARHAAAVVALVAVVVALRFALGEGRVGEVRAVGTSLPAMVLRSVIAGPFVSLTSFPRRSAAGLAALAGSGAILAGALALTALLALRLRRGLEPPAPGRAGLPRLAAAGVALTAVAYCFTLPPHFPPTAFAGLSTSVHVAAALGAAMAWAAALGGLLRLARGPAPRAAAAALVAAFLAAVWAFDVTVQQGYARAAEQQRRSWARLTCLAPDLPPGGLLLALGREEKDVTPYIASTSWGDSFLFRLVLAPAPGDPPASLVRLEDGLPGLEAATAAEGGRLRFGAGLPAAVEVDRGAPLDPRRLAVLERTPEGWRRRTAPLVLHGLTLPLEVPLPGPAQARPLRPGPLHARLVGAVGRDGCGAF